MYYLVSRPDRGSRESSGGIISPVGSGLARNNANNKYIQGVAKPIHSPKKLLSKLEFTHMNKCSEER